MKDTVIGPGCTVDKSIIAEEVVIGENCKLGVGENIPNKVNPKVYSYGLVTIGEKTEIPANVQDVYKRQGLRRNTCGFCGTEPYTGDLPACAGDNGMESSGTPDHPYSRPECWQRHRHRLNRWLHQTGQENGKTD